MRYAHFMNAINSKKAGQRRLPYEMRNSGDILKHGVSVAQRRRRVQALHRLFELFDGNDAAAEVRRLKLEDDGS